MSVSRFHSVCVCVCVCMCTRALATAIIITIIKHIYYSALTSKAIQRRCTIKPFMLKYIKKISQTLKSNLKKMCLQKRLKDSKDVALLTINALSP